MKSPREKSRGLFTLTHFASAAYHHIMSSQVIIETQKMTPEIARVFEQGRRNLLWFAENAERLGVFEEYRGRCVAAAGGELFVADTPEEAERLAHEKYPDDMPHVRYIYREKRSRIYASLRLVDSWRRRSREARSLGRCASG